MERLSTFVTDFTRFYTGNQIQLAVMDFVRLLNELKNLLLSVVGAHAPAPHRRLRQWSRDCSGNAVVTREIKH